MSHRVAVLVTAAVFLAPVSARSQEDSTPPELVEALVVNARTPGPAWWGVSKGAAKVWILALADDGFRIDDRWDLEPFERRLHRSGRLFHMQGSVSTTLSPRTAAADRPWINDLTPVERGRFDEVTRMAGMDSARYAALKPDVAALALVQALSGDKDAEPESRLLTRATALGVKPKRVGGRVELALRTSMRRAGSENLVCLNWVTKQLLQTDSHRAEAKAWMRGDVRSLVLGEMAYSPCQQGLARLKTASERQNGAMAREIARTLNKGGNAVVLVDLVPLLMRDGVLDQLRKRGYRIETPAQLDDEG